MSFLRPMEAVWREVVNVDVGLLPPPGGALAGEVALHQKRVQNHREVLAGVISTGKKFNDQEQKPENMLYLPDATNDCRLCRYWLRYHLTFDFDSLLENLGSKRQGQP